MMSDPYIRPRKKLPNETKQQDLARRLEEYIEFADAINNFSNRSFYEELLAYIDPQENNNE